MEDKKKKSPVSGDAERAAQQPQPTMVLGLDPGLSITGYGVIGSRANQPILIEAGILRIARNASLAERLRELHEGMTEILQSLPITCVAIEQLYSHYERPRTAILMGHARGVLCLAAAQAGLTVDSYEATKIKLLLTGSGRAPKSQMQLAIQGQLGLQSTPDPPDVADALAVALCHYFSLTRHPQLHPPRPRKTN